MDSEEFRETCSDFVGSVIGRLDSLEVGETFLQEEWGAIQSADEEESRFCETAAGLGWDPYDLDDARRESILRLADGLGKLLDEAIPALDTANPDAESSAIQRAIEDAKLNPLPLERLGAFRAKAGLYAKHARRDTAPWNAGYDLARRLRESLSLGGGPLPSMTQVASALGEDPDALDDATRPVAHLAGTRLINGVITRDDDANPAFAFRSLSDNGRRFHFCRALAEALTSPGTDTLITRATTERQQRNRAFAAEFLAPSSGLRERVGDRSMLDGHDIDELAYEFGVSSLVIERQIGNHRLARVSQDWTDRLYLGG